MSAFSADQQASTFRRIAASMWSRPSDPSIYGSMDLDATELLAFVERYRARTGQRLTVTHLVSAAVAHAFAKHPQLNAKVRLWGRVERRSTVDLFVSVATEGGKDLSGARIDRADALDLGGLIRAVEGGASRIRKGEDESYQKSRDGLRALPWWAVRPALRAIDFATNELHVPMPGAPVDPFGTAIVTNVGGFGIDTAFAPFLPMGRCAMLLLIGEVKARPWVVGDRIEPRPVLRLCATFDHRIVDGHGAGLVAKAIREKLDAIVANEPRASIAREGAHA
jgi:pyruvate dehydrogenase E2 component (dihydrolipoamide acetyltransferase)